MTTTNLAEFGYRELKIAGELLAAYKENETQAVKDYFHDDGVTVMMNTSSGNVFLTNSEHQVAMLDNDGMLDLWHTTPYHTHEGFADDLREIWEDDPQGMGTDDGQYLVNYEIITQAEYDEVFTGAA